MNHRWHPGRRDFDVGYLSAEFVIETIGLRCSRHDESPAIGVGEPVVPVTNPKVVKPGTTRSAQENREVVRLMFSFNREGPVGESNLDRIGRELPRQFHELETRVDG